MPQHKHFKLTITTFLLFSDFDNDSVVFEVKVDILRKFKSNFNIVLKKKENSGNRIECFSLRETSSY